MNTVLALKTALPSILIVPRAVWFVTVVFPAKPATVVIYPFVRFTTLMALLLPIHNVPALDGLAVLVFYGRPSTIPVTTALTVPFRKSAVPVPAALVPVWPSPSPIAQFFTAVVLLPRMTTTGFAPPLV